MSGKPIVAIVCGCGDHLEVELETKSGRWRAYCLGCDTYFFTKVVVIK